MKLHGGVPIVVVVIANAVVGGLALFIAYGW